MVVAASYIHIPNDRLSHVKECSYKALPLNNDRKYGGQMHDYIITVKEIINKKRRRLIINKTRCVLNTEVDF